jgi:hypothetical protein
VCGDRLFSHAPVIALEPLPRMKPIAAARKESRGRTHAWIAVAVLAAANLAAAAWIVFRQGI